MGTGCCSIANCPATIVQIVLMLLGNVLGGLQPDNVRVIRIGCCLTAEGPATTVQAVLT